MLRFASAFAGVKAPDWRAYPDRCARGVAALAQACGLDIDQEMARFDWCNERLGKQAKIDKNDNIVNQITGMAGENLPVIFEFVLTLAGDGPRGLAYLTQGRPSSNLPASLGSILEGTLQLHIEAGGDPAEAELLADLFGTSFPNLAGLKGHSPLAQGIITGVVPAGNGIQLKIYFNTRLDTSTPHKQRVETMLGRCGLDDQGLYDLLYERVRDARFQGVGVDLDNDQHRRAKIYVRLDREHLDPTLEALSTRLAVQRDAKQEIVAPVSSMVEALAGDAMVDEIELAAALRDDGPMTAKLTVFFASKVVTRADDERLCGYLDALGYPTDGVTDVLHAFSEPDDAALADRSPLHGVGIEVPVGERPKINLYVQPIV